MSWREFSRKPRVNEVLGLLLLLAGLLSGLALLSFNGEDASVAVSGDPARGTHNWIGPAGAFVSGGLYFFTGLTCWLVPPALLVAGWNRLRHRRRELPLPRILGFALTLCATATLLSLASPGRLTLAGHAFHAGGVVGERLAALMTWALGSAGAMLLALTLVTVGILVATPLSLSRATGHAEDAARRAGGAGRRLGARAAVGAAGLLGSGGRRGWTFLRRATAGLVARLKAARSRTAAPSPSRSGAKPWVKRTRAPEPLAPPATETEEPLAAPPPTPTATAPDPRPSAPAAAPHQADLPLPPDDLSRVQLPRTDLLEAAPAGGSVDEKDLLVRARLITEKCREFNVEGEVLEIHPGPVVTTFEFKPDAGIKLNRITALADDLALALEAESIRIDRIAGRSTVGIEVPNPFRETIHLREILESSKFRESPSKLTLALGKDQEGEVSVARLEKMPHILVAGSTGSGKSVGLNTMILSVLYKGTPEDVRLILIDPKMLELGLYDGIPHLLIPVVTDTRKAANALRWTVKEMERRYRILAACAVRHADQYNALVRRDPARVARSLETEPSRPEGTAPEILPAIVVIIDELADLMMTTSHEVEESIGRLAQMARAVGIHLVLATQRPSVDVLTGLIKANFPARIGYRVSSRIDSRTILDDGGAERLLGLGDMLFRPPGSARLMRLHGAWVSETETQAVVEFLKRQARPRYDESITADPEEESTASANASVGDTDPMYNDALRLVLSTGQASASFLQRRMRLGYARAARLIDAMEENGVVGAADGSKPREVLVGAEFLERLDQMDGTG